MIRSRVAFRFWTAMGAAPAAVATIASCRGNDARPPEAPVTPLVIGSGSAAPLDVTPPGTDESQTGTQCRIDQYRETTCRPLYFFDPTKQGETDPRACPATTPTGPWGPFGTETTARLDRERTETLANGYCCYEWCEQIKVTRKVVGQCSPPFYPRTECFTMPERGTSLPAEPPFDRCPTGVVMKAIDEQKGSFVGKFEPASSAVGEAETESRCCYGVCGPAQVRAIPGRAAREGDAIAMAPAIANASWRSDEHAGDATIALEDALFEHASIAAFSRLSLSLLAFGAPPDLLVGTHEAALDEIRHAQISFSRTGHAPIGPGPCPAFANLRAHATLADLAVETYVDGCIGETIASLRLRAVGMNEMARDEERHAELAWRIVEWALAIGGEEIRRRLTHVANAQRPGDDALARWAHANVVLPCTKTLLQAA